MKQSPILLLLVILATSSVALSAPAPNLSACYPAGFDPPTNVYTASSNSKTFVVVDAPIQKKRGAIAQLVFLQRPAPCKLIGNRAISLLAYMPMEAAISISRQRIEPTVNKIGRAAFQAALDEDLSNSDETSFIYPEQAAAYKQLGFRIPKKISVVEQPCELKDTSPIFKARMKDPKFAKEYKLSRLKLCPAIKK